MFWTSDHLNQSSFFSVDFDPLYGGKTIRLKCL